MIQTFYVSHSDPTELTQILSAIVRFPGIAIQPLMQPNKTSNTIVVRGSRPVVEIIGRLIAQNDKPRAEIVIDVEILEVNRSRAKQYGLNLTQYALGGILSPEVAPAGIDTPTSPGTAAAAPARPRLAPRPPPGSVTSPPPFNLNTISQGLTTSDFYLAVPTAIVRALESDTQHQAHRQAAAAGRRRLEAHAEAGRLDSRSSRRAIRRSPPAAPASIRSARTTTATSA